MNDILMIASTLVVLALTVAAFKFERAWLYGLTATSWFAYASVLLLFIEGSDYVFFWTISMSVVLACVHKASTTKKVKQ